ncbi:hypothetical protein BegalDRAFT_1471 [Beggiatoa alba B18LD]|uniref:Uncharacterized protein n=1 Tax=Beggiatoa alba B18LD TaxID=395493 RepID=I3CFG6_9GAMM|nr:hypothetical protein [Beggiatoa alba]EIJ42359.1 hypothetical protein BegalDRAFT_1471 [Beggiatoa alba B18LD]
MRNSLKRFILFLMVSFPLLFQSAFAVTCPSSDGTTLCEWASTVDFSDLMLAIGALILVIVPVAVAMLGGSKILSVLGWRRGSL